MNDEDITTIETDTEADIARLTALAEEEQARNEGVSDPTPEVTPPATPEVTPKAEETPPESKPKETPAATPKDDSTPDADSEKNRQAAAQRVKWTELERERDEWRRKAEDAETNRTPRPTDQPTVPPENVFTTLARANRGEFDQPGQNDQVRLAANRVILEEMSSHDIATVQRNALTGIYGESSAEIADLASKYLPVVQHKERETVETRERQTSAARQAYQEELAQATRENPAYADANTTEGKSVAEWRSVYMGDAVTALPKDVQAYIANHPKLLVHFVKNTDAMLSSKLSAAQNELKKLRQKIDSLEKKTALMDSPESPSAPIDGDETKGDDELAELHRKAEEEQARNAGRY